MGRARLWPLAAGTLLLGGCTPYLSQVATRDKAGTGLIWAGVIMVLILAILAIIRRLHAKGAAWQVTYLGANLTAAVGIFLLFTIAGAALLPASFARWATGLGAGMGTAWFVACAINLAPQDTDGAGLFWFFLGRNGSPGRAAPRKPPQKSPELYIEEPEGMPAEPVAFRNSSPQPAPEPQQVPSEIPPVMAPPITPAVALAAAPAVAMSASSTADNQYVPGSATEPDANPEDDRRCPHGIRRREYCPICDLEGFRENFGDWRTE